MHSEILDSLYHSDDILSDEDDSFIESNWQKIEDHSKSAKELLTQANAETAAKFSSDPDAVKNTVLRPLVELEHKARLSGDINTVSIIATEICAVHIAMKDFTGLLTALKQLMNARGQSHQAQTAMIKKIMEYVACFDVQMPFHGIVEEEVINAEKDTNAHNRDFSTQVDAFYEGVGDGSTWSIDEKIVLNILMQIRSLTNGKMHLELPYAQVSVILAKFSERIGKTDLALRLLQKASIDRLSALSKLEKTICLVYQLSLAIKQDDYVVFSRIARRISKSTLEKKQNAWLRHTYLIFLVSYFNFKKQYFATFLTFWELFLNLDQADTDFLKRSIYYLLLSKPEAPEDRQEAIEFTIFSSKYTENLDRAKWIIKFRDALDDMLSNSDLLQSCREDLFNDICFPSGSIKEILDFFAGQSHKNSEDFYALVKKAELLPKEPCEYEVKNLLRRLAEKNILVVSKFYTRIPIEQLAKYASTSKEEVEDILRVLVSHSLVHTRIDRVDQLVTFPDNFEKEDADTLNETVKELLDTIQDTCHLIERERLLKAEAQEA